MIIVENAPIANIGSHKIFLLLSNFLILSICLQVLENLNVDHLPKDELNKHVMRAGFSVNSTSLNLGKFYIS